MVLIRVYSLVVATAIIATSVWMLIKGASFQKIEQEAYASKRRPWWFICAAIAFISLFVVALIAFIQAEQRSWAAWVLMVILPAGIILKGALVVFNKKGQKTVTSIEGKAAWQKVALTRMALAPVFLLLAYFV